MTNRVCVSALFGALLLAAPFRVEPAAVGQSPRVVQNVAHAQDNGGDGSGTGTDSGNNSSDNGGTGTNGDNNSSDNGNYGGDGDPDGHEGAHAAAVDASDAIGAAAMGTVGYDYGFAFGYYGAYAVNVQFGPPSTYTDPTIAERGNPYGMSPAEVAARGDAYGAGLAQALTDVGIDPGAAAVLGGMLADIMADGINQGVSVGFGNAQALENLSAEVDQAAMAAGIDVGVARGAAHGAITATDSIW